MRLCVGSHRSKASSELSASCQRQFTSTRRSQLGCLSQMSLQMSPAPTTTWLQMLHWLAMAVDMLPLLPLIGGAYFPSLSIRADLGLLWPLECGRSGVQPVLGLLVRGLPVFAPSLWEYWLLKSSFHWEVRLVNPLHCGKPEPHWEVPHDETQCWRETRSTEAAGMWVKKPP